MKIVISKRTGEILQKAIYSIVRSCDKNKDNDNDFEADELQMKKNGLKMNDLADLVKLSNQIDKKSNAKN